jgi:hypothetical protein
MGMSPEDLMEKLKASKKIIKDTENIVSINGSIVKKKPTQKKKVVQEEIEGYTTFSTDNNYDDGYEKEIPLRSNKVVNTTPASSGNLTEQQRMKNLEKLPEVIRKAMMENPIPKANSVSIFDDSLINEIANSGNEEIIQEEIITTRDIKPKMRVENKKNIVENLNDSNLISIIEEIVDRKFKEYYDSKLVSENIQIKVGSTVFSGNLKPLPKKN